MVAGKLWLVVDCGNKIMAGCGWPWMNAGGHGWSLNLVIAILNIYLFPSTLAFLQYQDFFFKLGFTPSHIKLNQYLPMFNQYFIPMFNQFLTNI